jgi:acyl-CoA synthetase (AMP-forming)/AMP-acid ligase II
VSNSFNGHFLMFLRQFWERPPRRQAALVVVELLCRSLLYEPLRPWVFRQSRPFSRTFAYTAPLATGSSLLLQPVPVAQKVPRSTDFEDQLPRLPTGKLYKRLLRDRYWGNKTSRIV